MNRLKEAYKELTSVRNRIRELEEEIAKLQADTFGEEDTEEGIAKRFFSELALSTEHVESMTKELQEKRKLLDEAKREQKKAEEEFLRSLTSLKFPLRSGSEAIEKKNNEIFFYFSEEVETDVLDEMRRFLGKDCLSSSNVEIQKDKIVARNAGNISEAMKEVITHVETKIWKTATGMLEVDKYVVELKNRDEKIQKMLYVLFKEGKALSKKEIEMKSGLETGALRGVLYFVLRRDPYLKEVEKGLYSLTDIGKKVVERYNQKHGSPLQMKPVGEKTLINFEEENQGEVEF